MKRDNVRIGMILKLKPERQSAYGMQCDRVRITEIKERKGYVDPYLGGDPIDGSDGGFFRCADFLRCVAYADWHE